MNIQFKVVEKNEVLNIDDAKQFKLTIVPIQEGVTGALVLTTVSDDENSSYETGDIFTVPFTNPTVEG